MIVKSSSICNPTMVLRVIEGGGRRVILKKIREKSRRIISSQLASWPKELVYHLVFPPFEPEREIETRDNRYFSSDNNGPES